MAQENWRTPELTPEEKTARLILDRFKERPPVDVRRIACDFATIEERPFPVSCDAVTIRKPADGVRPRILLNTNSTSYEPRRRFTLSHEIGHIKIPWHGGSIACHVGDRGASVVGSYHSYEAEAHRFASELLMPTDWIGQVVEDERTIGKIFNRVVGEARVSKTAARIKLMKNLPPGFICVGYDLSTDNIEWIEESRHGCMSLFIEPGDRSSFARLAKALEFHAIDGADFVYGSNIVRWWRMDPSYEMPATEEIRSSSDILREIAENLFDTRERQNNIIWTINGHASLAYQQSFELTERHIYGPLRLRFDKRYVNDSNSVKLMTKHPLWDEYLIAKAKELASGRTSRSKSSRSKKSG